MLIGMPRAERTSEKDLARMLYAEGLRDRGHDIRLIVEPESPIHEMAEHQKFPVITLSMRQANDGGTTASSKTQDY